MTAAGTPSSRRKTPAAAAAGRVKPGELGELGEFPAPDRLDADAAAVWAEVIAAHHEPARIVGPDLEAYCGQVATQRDARARIAREGLIIEDERGRPDVHPAIALELKAQAEIRAWGDKFRGRAKRPEPRERGAR